MKTHKPKFDKQFLIRWLTANFIAWPIGLILAIILSYSIVNIFHPKETNLIVGFGIGVSVGFAQWFVLKNIINLTKWWIVASGLGIGIPYATLILLKESNVLLPSLFNIEGFYWGMTYFASGAIVGIIQMKMLRTIFSNSYLWIIISCIAWGLALSLNSFLISGIIIGLITALAFV